MERKCATDKLQEMKRMQKELCKISLERRKKKKEDERIERRGQRTGEKRHKAGVT